jgi:PD-(D/E)XK nuclease superfamily
MDQLRAALLGGDAKLLEKQLQAFTMNMLSYHDTAIEPEQVAHAFVIGLLATLEPTYEVRSNRESGFGRPDVMIRPRKAGLPGVVLELKIAKKGGMTPEAALSEGLAQIEERAYLAELRAAGANPVHAFAVAFDGKRVWVRSAAEPGAKKKRPRTAAAKQRAGARRAKR